MAERYRKEVDFIGEINVPADAMHGIHTARALENFALSGRRVHPALISAYGYVKLACAMVNRSLNVWADSAKADAIVQACHEMAEGKLDSTIVVDALQGGAGTSTNMNVNEVLANRALQILGEPLGKYSRVSPLDDINLHQSTNDTYPTAVKLAGIRLISGLEESIVALQEAFQTKEKEFANIVKIGRTQLQDAVLLTLGCEMSAYAEALSRDRWRIYKAVERLRVVNLGGTAVGTGLAAPRQFIFGVVETLRDITGVGFARAENLIDNTQNADVFVEVSGLLKACAATLYKISTDLRILSSGPQAGIGEIHLPARQAGSSIMPGKVNPVIPEAVSQASMTVFGLDHSLTMAAAAGNLELNQFMPLIADNLLGSITLLTNACVILRRFCVEGLKADEARCKSHVESSTAVLTALLPRLGYEAACKLAHSSLETGKSIKELVVDQKLLTQKEFDDLISPEAICRLGEPDGPARRQDDATHA